METEADVRFALEELSMSLTLRPKVPMSEDHLLRFCRSNKGYQIQMEPDGSLSIDQPKGPLYSRAIVILSSEVYGWAERDERGISFPDVGVYFPDGSMRAPGVAWLSLEKWQSIPRDDRDRFLHVVPEFVAEIRCHTDIWRERMKLLWFGSCMGRVTLTRLRTRADSQSEQCERTSMTGCSGCRTRQRIWIGRRANWMLWPRGTVFDSRQPGGDAAFFFARRAGSRR